MSLFNDALTIIITIGVIIFVWSRITKQTMKETMEQIIEFFKGTKEAVKK